MTKIFLLTGFSTEMKYGGGAIVRSLLERFEPKDVAWFSLAAPSAPLDPRLEKLLVGHYSYRAFGNQRLRLNKFWAWFHRTIWPKLAAKRIMSALAESGASTLWIVLDYHVVPVAAELVWQRPATHLHFSIHDHPNEMARHHFISAASVAAIDDGFEVVHRSDASFDAVSEELIDAVGLSQRPNTVVTMGCDQMRRTEVIVPPADVGPLRVGYAGSYLPPQRAQELVDGLKLWSAGTGRAWELHVFGAPTALSKTSEVRVHDFVPPDTLFKELGKMDMLLLALDGYDVPSAPAVTCLPTKLVSYLEVGRLVLAMVPVKSATARIVRDASLGPIVSTSDPREVARAVDDALHWNVDRAVCGRADLLNDRFSSDAIFRRFVRLAVPEVAMTRPAT